MKTRFIKAQCGYCGYVVYTSRKNLLRGPPKCDAGNCPEPGWPMEFDQSVLHGYNGHDAPKPDAGFKVLRDRWVKIRKPHRCASCRLEFHAGDEMHSRTYPLDGGIVTDYTCLECEGHSGRRLAVGRA